ncbi:MAG: DNA mismatch repair endonuclease MutL [Spirochaetales bacterium]|nr:DNA mismatch repair endonuclease MutL [Spirochaetales bacterium]
MIDEPSRRIRILREDVSRKIAAGEVIDRPLSVVRELLDNAIDAGARSVETALEGGGLARIRVVDDGLGMSREDLELCWQRHATSKIQAAEDLYRVRTLGFRGEALASIAACSRLSIVSRPRDDAGAPGEAAARLVVEGGRRLVLEEHQGPPGTSVDVADLFFNLPPRRRFLKSPSAESALCRQAFLEKALPHPQVAFRLSAGGELKHFFPALGADDYKGRVAAAFGFEQGLVYGVEGGGGGVGVRAVVGRPELNRRDRKMVQLYVNRRRVFEYGLVQAVEYAYSEYLPGGHHPVAFLFLELDPAEVDFNIHPAKREVRFRDLAGVRGQVSATLREFLRAFDLKRPPLGGAASGQALQGPAIAVERALGFHGIEDQARPASQPGEQPGARSAASPSVAPVPAGPPARPVTAVAPTAGGPAESPGEALYRGQIFGLFLLVESGDTLYVVDQHAAHERVLFERMRARPPVSQELLMPLRVEPGPQADRLLERAALLRERFAVRLERAEDGAVEIAALPEELLALEAEELVAALLWEQGSVEELIDRVYALAACRLAVKEGQELDPGAAQELVRQVFALENARCPHGRPIWTQLKRQDLEKGVGRE